MNDEIVVYYHVNEYNIERGTFRTVGQFDNLVEANLFAFKLNTDENRNAILKAAREETRNWWDNIKKIYYID